MSEQKRNTNQDVSGEKLHDLSPKRVQDMPMVNYSEGIHSILHNSDTPGHSFDGEAKTIYQNNLYRVSAYVFSANIILILLASIALDFYEQHYNIILPLVALLIPAIFTFFWLYDKKRNPAIPLIFLGCSATVLCAYILIGDGPSDGSAALWVSIYPSTAILYLGLRYGTAMFIAFYAFLLGLFYTPLGDVVIVPLSESMQIRLLMVCFASFVFVWFIEFARFKTNLALHKAAHRIEQSSLTDALTGLGNRRDFDRSLAWTMARASRNNVQFSLAILDIDHFKRVNDTYGHAVGDQVLTHIASEVETQIRNADRMFRWGGEEFAIIMPATTMNKAMAGAERIRMHIEKTPFLLGSEQIFLTVSLGLYSGTESSNASYPMHIADQCLYRAKSTGRNKVVGGV